MSLTFVPVPPSVELAARQHLGHMLQMLDINQREIELTQALPLYTADTRDFLGGPFSKSKDIPHTAWEIPLRRGSEPYAAFELRIEHNPQGGTSYENAGLAFGQHAVSLERAVQSARLHAEGDEEYEVRLLRAPTLYLYGVWLKGGSEDLLIPIRPAPLQIGEKEVLSAKAASDALHNLAVERSRNRSNLV